MFKSVLLASALVGFALPAHAETPRWYRVIENTVECMDTRYTHSTQCFEVAAGTPVMVTGHTFYGSESVVTLEDPTVTDGRGNTPRLLMNATFVHEYAPVNCHATRVLLHYEVSCQAP